MNNQRFFGKRERELERASPMTEIPPEWKCKQKMRFRQRISALSRRKNWK